MAMYKQEDVVEYRQNSYMIYPYPTSRRSEENGLEGLRALRVSGLSSSPFMTRPLQADEDHSWAFDSQRKLKKGVGKGIHQSDFIDPVKG